MLLLVSACGPRDATYDPSHFQIHAQIAPRDVAVPSNDTSVPLAFNGLYAVGPDSLSCCWIAPQARLLVRKHAPARTLVAGVRIPNVPRFAKGQRITVTFPGTGAPPQRSQRFAAGDQTTLKFSVPPELRDAKGLIPVAIASDVDFVPHRDAVPTESLLRFLRLRTTASNEDVRHLGLELLYLYFQ